MMREICHFDRFFKILQAETDGIMQFPLALYDKFQYRYFVSNRLKENDGLNIGLIQ